MIQIVLKDSPDLQVVIAKDGTKVTIDEIYLREDNGVIKKGYSFMLKDMVARYKESDCTPESLAKAIASIAIRNN